MGELPTFSLSDITDVNEEQEGFVRPLREPGDAAVRRSRVHCVRWSSLPERVVVMKEVHLWEEDTVTSNVHTIAAHIARLQSSTHGLAVASYFVEYLAMHVDTPHHYQWLLSRCGPPLKTLLDRSTTRPCLSENCCKHVLHCVLTALHHLHDVCGLVHGDVSLGNIFIDLAFEESSDVLLGDLETLTPLGAAPSSFPGTPLYTAPERLQNSSLACAAHDDVWAVVITAYQLLTWVISKAHPWFSDHLSDGAADDFWTFLDALNARKALSPLEYLQKTPMATCSRDALAVVAACLSWEPSGRPTASALLQLPWFSD